MDNYFKSNAIGSSLLSACIVSVDPLAICTDRAIADVKPSSFMETGKIFEDLVEETFGGEEFFWNKYFKSDLKTFPETDSEKTGLKNILQMLEDERALQDDIENGYVYTKPDKAGNVKLNDKYINRHRCLDQIKAHGYRRPIIAPIWEKIEIMLERFKSFPFEFRGNTFSIETWITEYYAAALFQVDYFWSSDGASCRAKFDMIWIVEIEDIVYAIPFDLKVTADDVQGEKSFGAFVRNWRQKYIWQSKHYHEGFQLWCAENGYVPHDTIHYLIQESEYPQITNCWALEAWELTALDAPYRQALPVIQAWIDAGKPVKGYMTQINVNRYGKEWGN